MALTNSQYEAIMRDFDRRRNAHILEADLNKKHVQNTIPRIKEIDDEEQISGYEYEVIACMDAINKGKLECDDMPHELTVMMMQIMDNIREQWGLEYPDEMEE